MYGWMAVDEGIDPAMVTNAGSHIAWPGGQVAALDPVSNQIAIQKVIAAAPGQPGMCQKVHCRLKGSWLAWAARRDGRPLLQGYRETAAASKRSAPFPAPVLAPRL